ncbi:RNA-binding S4 domain-containing protein [Pseudorhizobium endolithicum]|uniref:RNA-binding S4 domain-containing protein n=1 Tax=Pseudorhizobium endolithicum TaxID=1191678 RepID=A0ABN7JTL6_9HYPH|nr:RNA-binding S4 domain-containing protein [Pseudorhizobium endolithicum]CAD6431255.1 RNA-binding S4 domain-containing protein [Rhizobium sp. Q54]CAD7047605.1 RNA-binding S4 domain-containing protein [Pseudorhizobium endolithicum]
MEEVELPDGSPQRIDKWLFFTRMVKSRSIAQSLVAAGSVTVNGAVARQSSLTVRPGDKVGIALERRDVLLVVRAGGSRRGPFEEARLLYSDISESLGEQKVLTPFERAQRRPKP